MWFDILQTQIFLTLWTSWIDYSLTNDLYVIPFTEKNDWRYYLIKIKLCNESHPRVNIHIIVEFM